MLVVMNLPHGLRRDGFLWASSGQLFSTGTVPIHPAIGNGPRWDGKDTLRWKNRWEMARNPVSMSQMVVKWMNKSWKLTTYTDDCPYCNVWVAVFQVEPSIWWPSDWLILWPNLWLPYKFKLRCSWMTSWVGYCALVSLASFILATEI